MKLFKLSNKKSGKVDEKFVGGFIPLHLFSFLNLYTIAKGVSKTAILTEIISNWKRGKEGSRINEQALILVISDALKNDFERFKQEREDDFKKEPNLERDIFISMVRRELRNRSINKEIIDKIINKITE